MATSAQGKHWAECVRFDHGCVRVALHAVEEVVMNVAGAGVHSGGLGLSALRLGIRGASQRHRLWLLAQTLVETLREADAHRARQHIPNSFCRGAEQDSLGLYVGTVVTGISVLLTCGVWALALIVALSSSLTQRF
jgi:hypothetical protein